MTPDPWIPKEAHRPLRTAGPAAPLAVDRPKLTPPCRCGYPLVSSDKECPRCHAAPPWTS